ncbi:metal-response element-binding transcription factor 2 isoform X1 [Lepeophtheirus salmonis]|uniref:metal-response element-binding transcription factor 2 isoform X1 n=1 Tax=Lepeophtheirus salmonis TaxID=72036 RepID=UPI001AE26217|nr:metal-response element-binding transcription factor 2-like isoform X1 [Lepeophtheirus salmonis]
MLSMDYSGEGGLFREGDDVLQLGEDGVFYLGVVVEVEECSGCLVRFGDRSERWSRSCMLKRLEEDPPEAPPLNKRCIAETLVPCRVLEARKELSYRFEALEWDGEHLRNAQDRYCYCGQSGDWYKRMLQCEKCEQWFHQECIRATTSLLFGDRFWRFLCTLCTGKCEEIVERLDISWTDALHLVLFNLTITNNKKFHDLETSILPFIRSKWKYFVGPSALLAKSKANVNYIDSLLASNPSRFKSGSELKKRSTFWGLRRVAPPNGPHASHNTLKVESSFIKREVTLSSRGRRILKPPPAMKFSGNNASSSKRLRRRSGCEIFFTEGDNPLTKGTLDFFIPIPKNFEGLNNPFRLNRSSNTSSTTSSSCSSPNPAEPLHCNNNNEDGNNFFKDLKSSLNSYFVNSDIISQKSSDKFRVLARRLTSAGEVQYLVDRGDASAMIVRLILHVFLKRTDFMARNKLVILNNTSQE